MNHLSEERTELFLRFSRQSMIAMLFVVLLLGGSALALMFLPQGGGYLRTDTLIWWLSPVILAGVIAFAMSVRRRSWPAHAPEVEAVTRDEWRRTSLSAATRLALIAGLLAQFPLGWALHLGFDMPLRATLAMGTATITLCLVILLVRFLYLDRD